MRAIHLALLFVVLLTEGWMLNDFWNDGSLSWESTVAFVGSLISLVFAEPVVQHFAPPVKAPVLHKASPSDIALFREFQDALPHDPTIITIKEHDFGNSVRSAYLEPLFRFVSTWSDVNKEFVDPEIEAKKSDLYSHARQLSTALAKHTVPEGPDSSFMTVFPELIRGSPRPEHVLNSARILNQLSNDFIPKYEGFVRLAKAKLG